MPMVQNITGRVLAFDAAVVLSAIILWISTSARLPAMLMFRKTTVRYKLLVLGSTTRTGYTFHFGTCPSLSNTGSVNAPRVIGQWISAPFTSTVGASLCPCNCQNGVYRAQNGVYRAQKPEKPENPGFNNYCIFWVFCGDLRFK